MITRLLHRLNRLARDWLGSRRFFYIIVGLLVVQAGWIAISARYPQAFDENYHLGLIQLHTTQWLPFFTSQPPGDALYGALARDPSYLYQYLLSLPYQLLTHITDSQTVQVIVLRFMNIAIFVGGLFAYRTLFARLGVSRRLMHVVLLFFVLTPVMPLLAAQINYDNLMFLLVGLLFERTVVFYRRLHELAAAAVVVKPDAISRLPSVGTLVVPGLQLLLIGMAGSLVKYPFAPIFAGCVLALLFCAWRIRRKLRGWLVAKHENRPRTHAAAVAAPDAAGRTSTSRPRLVLLIVATLLLFGLCVERYGVNLVAHQSLVPKCDKVLSVDECMDYSPWARDHMYAATYPKPTAWGIFVYPGVWVHRTVYETMFTITSSFWEESTPNRTIAYYYPADPLPIANFTAWSVVTIGVIASLFYWRRFMKRPALLILFTVIVFYGLILFGKNFMMYLHTGEAVAIHGRYFIPVYPVLYLMLALSFGWLLERFKLARYKTALFLVVLVLFLQGAGLLTWLLRSEYWWYWPQLPWISQLNWWLHMVLERIVLR